MREKCLKHRNCMFDWRMGVHGVGGPVTCYAGTRREAEADAPSSRQAVRDVDAEVLEERLASSGQAGPSYGPQYLYSAPRLERRLGPDFARSIPSVCALMQSLRCG